MALEEVSISMIGYWTCFYFSGCPLNMKELLRLNVHEEVGDNYYKFGVFLLDDSTSNEVDEIEAAHKSNAARVRTILKVWLNGKGEPATWYSLIKVLRDCQLMHLANTLEEKIFGGEFYTCVS